MTVSGTARPGASVDLYMAGAATPFATVTADSTTGVFSRTVSISRNTTFKAMTAKATSNAVVARVVSTVKIVAKVGRKHRVTVTVTGGPSKAGTVVLWQRLRGGKVIKLGTAKVTKGIVSWSLKPGAGSHIYRATFTSSGCDISSTVSISVKS